MHPLRLLALCASLAAAQAVPQPPNDIVWCTTDAGCAIFDDLAARCNATTNRCMCGTGATYLTHTVNATVRTAYVCAGAGVNRTAALETRRRVAVYQEYPMGNCDLDVVARLQDIEEDVIEEYGEHLGRAANCGGIRTAHTVNMTLKDLSILDLPTLHAAVIDKVAENDTLRAYVGNDSFATAWLMDNKTVCSKKDANVTYDFTGECRAMECNEDFKRDEDWMRYRCIPDDDDIGTAAIIGFSIVAGASVVAAILGVQAYKQAKAEDAERELMNMEPTEPVPDAVTAPGDAPVTPAKEV